MTFRSVTLSIYFYLLLPSTLLPPVFPPKSCMHFSPPIHLLHALLSLPCWFDHSNIGWAVQTIQFIQQLSPAFSYFSTGPNILLSTMTSLTFRIQHSSPDTTAKVSHPNKTGNIIAVYFKNCIFREWGGVSKSYRNKQGSNIICY